MPKYLRLSNALMHVRSSTLLSVVLCSFFFVQSSQYNTFIQKPASKSEEHLEMRRYYSNVFFIPYTCLFRTQHSFLCESQSFE